MMQGILIVDKPTDWTSFDVIAKLRGILGTRKLGHSGTLDPMATGVLPVFVGQATRAVSFAEDGEKEYIAGLRLGRTTDTQDTSGETLDTMAALREAKKRGARILSIVNVVGSSIARESDDVLYTWAGPEIAVATTKAYSTQMAVLNLLGLYFGEVMGTVDYETYTAMVRDILALPEKLEQVLAQADQIQQIAKDFAGRDDVFFIGRNLDYALSMEGSLKLKEISYIHSEAYASGELKHGTISLIEEGTPVIALSTYGPLFDKAMSNVVEVQARGANVLALTTETHRDAMAARTPRVLTVPEVEPMLLPQLGVAPLQLLAYYIALERGCDIDKPRNLAKSVTVE